MFDFALFISQNFSGYSPLFVAYLALFSIHVLTSFLHGYSATLAAKLLIKLELRYIRKALLFCMYTNLGTTAFYIVSLYMYL